MGLSIHRSPYEMKLWFRNDIAGAAGFMNSIAVFLAFVCGLTVCRWNFLGGDGFLKELRKLINRRKFMNKIFLE